MSAKIFVTGFENVPGPEILRVDLSEYFEEDFNKETTALIYSRVRDRIKNCVRSDNFKLHWKDNDGDWILCETDEDFLEMALVMTDDDEKTWPTIHFKAEPCPETRPASETPNSQGWVTIGSQPAVDEPDSDTQESHEFAGSDSHGKGITEEADRSREVAEAEKLVEVAVGEHTVVKAAGIADSGAEANSDVLEITETTTCPSLTGDVCNGKHVPVPEPEFPFCDTPLVSVSDEIKEGIPHAHSKDSSCHVS